MNAFGAYMYGYDTKEYTSVEDFIRESYAPETVKNNLVAVGVYKKFINDESKLNAEIDELIDELMVSSGTNDRNTAISSAGGENAVRQEAIIRLAQEYLIANNTIDWNVSAES